MPRAPYRLPVAELGPRPLRARRWAGRLARAGLRENCCAGSRPPGKLAAPEPGAILSACRIRRAPLRARYVPPTIASVTPPVMRRALLAGAVSLASIGLAHAKVGFNLQTYERCAALLGAAAAEAPWAKTADWYLEASGAFVLAAAEERLRLRGERARSWLQVRVEARAVEEALKREYDAPGEDLRKDPKLLEFCVAIGEAIVPVVMDAYEQN